MLLAEEMLLLLTDPVTGRPLDSGQRTGLVLAGAVLVELMQSGHVEVTAKDSASVRAGRVVVLPATAPGDPVLDESLRRLASSSRPRKAQDVLPGLAKNLRETLHERLTTARVLRAEPVVALGLTWTTRHPAVDPRGPSAALRARVREVVLGSRRPDAHDVTLVALLNSVNRVPHVVGETGLSKSEVRQRAKHIGAADVGGEAVRRAIQAAEAVASAVTVATVVVAGGSSG